MGNKKLNEFTSFLFKKILENIEIAAMKKSLFIEFKCPA